MVRLFIVFLLCLITIQGCGAARIAEQSRIERLDFEVYSLTSRLDRLESKIDMSNWSMSHAGLSESSLATDGKQLEKLLVDLKAQISSLKEQLSRQN